MSLWPDICYSNAGMKPISGIFVETSARAAAIRARLKTVSGAPVFAEFGALESLLDTPANRPSVVVVDPLFLATARGAALVSRMFNDPQFSEFEVCVLAGTSGEALVRLVPPTKLVSDHLNEPDSFRAINTRQVGRFHVARLVKAALDDAPAELIDLSTEGCQVLTRMSLHLGQHLHVTLGDDAAETQCRATIAWTTTDRAAGGERRAGIRFIGQDVEILKAFCARGMRFPSNTVLEAANQI